MSATFAYPGAASLDKVRDALPELTATEFSAVLTNIEELNRATKAGLSLQQIREATTLLFALLIRVCDAPKVVARLELRWLEKVVTELQERWYKRIALLPPDVQYECYQSVDEIYSWWAMKRKDEEALARVEQLFFELPIPAVRGAVLLLDTTMRPGEVTATHLRCMKTVEQYADDVAPLLYVAKVSTFLWFQYGQTCAQFSGKEKHHLHELWEFQKQLTALFGADMSVYKIGFLGSGDKKLAAVEQRAQLLKQLTEHCYFTPSHPWVRNFEKFLQARIEAATNDVKAARKEFKKLLAAEFAIWDTAGYLAFIHNFLKDGKDARLVLEELALAVPVVQGQITADMTLGEIYAEADGRPEQLGHPGPPGVLQIQAEQNRARRQSESMPKLVAAGKQAIAEFWAAGEQSWQRYLAKTFVGAHFDAALGEISSSLTIQLSAAVLASCCIDELPALAMLDRAVLIAATERPTVAKQVASEILRYLDALSAGKRTFEDLTMAFPGFGHSLAVVWRHLRPRLAAGRIDEAKRIFDHLETLAGMPDQTLAQLFSRAAEVLLAHSTWMDTLQRGRRLVQRFGDASAKTVVARLLSEHGVKRLHDEAAAASQLAVCELLIELADASTQRKLLDWSAAQLRRSALSDAALTAGELLASRLPPPLAAQARSATAEALFARLDGTALAAAEPTIHRLQRLYAEDKTWMTRLAAWYVRRATGEPGESAIRLGEWLTGQVTTVDAREQIRIAVRDLLLASLSTQSLIGAAQLEIERVLRIGGQDQQTQDRLAGYYESWQPVDADAIAARAQLGEWLIVRVVDAPAERIRAIARQAIEGLLQAAQDRGARIHQLQRLLALYPHEAQLAQQLSRVRKEQLMLHLKIAGLLTVLLAVLTVILMFVMK